MQLDRSKDVYDHRVNIIQQNPGILPKNEAGELSAKRQWAEECKKIGDHVTAAASKQFWLTIIKFFNKTNRTNFIFYSETFIFTVTFTVVNLNIAVILNFIVGIFTV